ncbi:MAG: ATP-dependent sacrificial sulfur transferase LarE [Polyangiaceae bacterium]|nr:ATP-dependent sacrificial sulfur transferase LarE [Polyangiaceae bacterium]
MAASDVSSFETTISVPIEPKLARLRSILRDMESVLVCYSGGIDSALVLAVAHQELGAQAIGITAVSPSLPEGERADAARIALDLGAAHHFVSSNEIAREGYVKNDSDRCFHCKTELYEVAQAKQKEWNLKFIANGTNLDDLGDYRPGLVAAKNAEVRSPLIEAEFSKADVRAAARALHMDVWDKPAAACLSSRIPYGTSVTTERLAQIGGFEADLKALGFRQLRVRWHDKIARLELALSELERLLEPGLREQVVLLGKKHGFSYTTVDLGGYRTGSHNEVLVGKHLRVV